MTNLNEKISRRKFLQLTAGAAIGAAMLNVPGMTFAAGAKVKAANYNKLPDAVPLAKDAELVQLSYKKIQDAVSSIKDSTLRSMTAEIINNPNPAFMENYQLPGSKRALYNKLAAAGLLDTSKISAEQLLPPYSGKLPQPFYSAPGSATQATMLIRAGWQRIRPLTCAFPKAFTILIRTFLTATSAAILSFPHRRCTIWQNRWYSSGRKTRLRCLNTPLPLPAHTIF